MAGFDFERYMQDYELRRRDENFTPQPTPDVPAGFTLDTPSTPSEDVPGGFVLDNTTPDVPAGFTLDNNQPPAEVSPPDEMGLLERYLVNPFMQGKNQTVDQALNVGGLLTGMSTPEEFAAGVVQDQQEAANYPLHPDDQALLAEIQNSDSFWGALGQIASNPSILPVVLSQSLPAMAGTVAGSVGGGLAGSAMLPGPGTAAGAAIGAGAASGATEFASSIVDALIDAGVEPTEENLARAVQDPALMATAKDYALKRGVAVGVFDALSAGVAGRIAKPVEKLVGTGVGGRVAGLAAEVVGQSAGGAGGEMSAQLATKGEVSNPGAVALEAAAEIPGAALEVPATVLARKPGEMLGAAKQTVPQASPEAEVPTGFQLDPAGATEPSVLPVNNVDIPVGQPQITPQSDTPGSENAIAPNSNSQPGFDPPAGDQQAASSTPVPTEPPAPSPAVPSASPAPTKTERVTTPDGSFETDVEFQVVEADDLKSAQGELQPRDRASRVGSDMQVQNIASKLDPLRLMSSRETDRGAPIVDETNTILSGNGRTAAIIAAMTSHPEKYQAYRTSLDQSGFDTTGFKNPVLVRKALNITPEDKRRFAVKSNAEGGLGLSPTERAGIEQEYVSPDMLNSFDTDVEGGVTAGSNAGFVRSFLKQIPTTEQASFINKDGALTPMGAQRIAGAIFAKAYGDKSLVERFVEDEKDPAIRNALTGAAPAWAAMKASVGDNPDLDITKDLVEAVALINKAKTAGMTMANFTAQQDAFNQTPPRVQKIAKVFFNKSGNRLAAWRDVRDRLKSYAEAAANTKNADGDIFGGPGPTADTILDGILAGIERKTDAQTTQPETPPTAQGMSGTELFSGSEVLSKAPPKGGNFAAQSPEKQAASPSLLDSYDEGSAELDTELNDFLDDYAFVENEDVSGEDVRLPRGTLTPKTEEVSFSKNVNGSIYEEAFRVAGLTPDEGRLLKPEQRRNVLRRVLEDTFGIKVNLAEGANKLGTLQAQDQMLDAYRNVRFMMHVLELPVKGVSLGGTLTLALEKFRGKYLGAYSPMTKTIHMPGRSNSFAHEWLHALDHFMLDKLKPGSVAPLLSQLARSDGLDATKSIEAAFANVIQKMFYDEADLAATILRLEKDASQVNTKGVQTSAAREAEKKLERLVSGATRIPIKPSNYRLNSAAYGQASGGEGGKQYYSSVHEMLARAFEAYVAHKMALSGGTNEFVTKGDEAYLGEADGRLKNTFPKDSERLKIFSAFDDLMHHVRVSTILGTDPAASRPQDVDVFDPVNLNKLVLEQGEPGLVQSVRQELARLKNLPGALTISGLKSSTASWVSNMGIDPTAPGKETLGKVARMLGDTSRMFFGSYRSVMNAIVRRNEKNSDGGMFLKFITDMVQTNIGTGNENTTTFEEARENGVLRAANEISALLKVNGFSDDPRALKHLLFGDEANDNVRELLYGENVPGASEKEKAVAAGLRRLFDKTWRDATDRGVEMGYLENKGYMPRVVLQEKIMANPDDFVKDASKVYEIQFDNITSTMSPKDVLGFARTISGRVQPEARTPLDGPFGNEISALIKALRKLAKINREIALFEQRIRLGEQGNMATQQEIDGWKQKVRDLSAQKIKAQDEVSAANDALLDVLRKPYSDLSADDWKGRILIGDSSTYDTHGPLENFTKNRKLPPEADAILKDWYDTDVLHLTLSYVHHAQARAAYIERFGKASGAKKLEDVIRRQDVRDQISLKPTRYDVTTPQGRLNILKDLANKKTDNILEMALWEAQSLGADGKDVRTLRGAVEDITGRGAHAASPVSEAANKVANAIYVATYVWLLPKAAMTAITEPLTVLMRTGDFKATAATFGAYMMEAVRAAKTTQERAAFARAIGLVSTPLFDTVLMNRLSGDFGNAVSGNVILSRFFRANGLTQLTNAQRRSVAAGGFYWLRSMAKTMTDPGTSSTNREVARAEFLDLGVPAQHVDALADWINQHPEHPTLDDLQSKAGQMYAAALVRYVDQTIQNPRRADKPAAVASPLGRMIYALTSFAYTFFQNVHIAALNRTKRNYRIAREQGESKMTAAAHAAASPFATLGVGFLLMSVAQLLVTAAREAVFNQEQWESKDDEERKKWLMQLAFSRVSALGPADILLNALTGLKYERDLSSLAVGPGNGYLFSNAQNIILGLMNKSPNSNADERAAAKAVYRLTAAPAASVMLSAINVGGPVGWAARYGAMTYLTSNSAASSFADETVGEKRTLRKGDEGYTQAPKKKKKEDEK